MKKKTTDNIVRFLCLSDLKRSVPTNSAVAVIPDHSLNQFSPLARFSYLYIPSPSSRHWNSTPASRTRPNITRSLFSGHNLSFKAKVLGYFKELRQQQQKENVIIQKAIQDNLDALVSVQSEPVHFVLMTLQ